MIKRVPIFLLFIITSILSLKAQTVQDTPKLKTPKMEIFWGESRGGVLTVADVLSLIDSSIIVIADKKEKLIVSRAIFIYRSKDSIEDEETGTIKTRYNSNSYNYRNTDRLPVKWKEFLKENIKPGDQLIIADILVRNKYNEIYKAGDIKIIIE